MTRMLERVSFDRGVHLRGTPLWFDPEAKRGFAVLTGLPPRVGLRHVRVAASADLSEALARAKHPTRVLPVPWERWTNLGGQRVQLLPAGGELGAAVALVADGSRRLLVGGLLRCDGPPLPRAELLIATVPALEHRGAALGQVVRALEGFLLQAQREGVRALVWVDHPDAALSVARGLAAGGRAPRLAGLLGQLAPDWQASSPAATVATVGMAVRGAARVAFVDTGLSSWRGKRPGRVDATFRLRYWADRSVLRRAVAETRAGAVALVGVSNQRSLASLGRVELRLWVPPRQLELAPSGATSRRTPSSSA